MALGQIYIATSIIVLAIVSILLVYIYKDTKKKRLSKLASLAFFFILAGILFGEDRLIGYSLMGIGIAIAIADIVLKAKPKISKNKPKKK